MGWCRVIPLPGGSPIPTCLTAHGHFWWNSAPEYIHIYTDAFEKSTPASQQVNSI